MPTGKARIEIRPAAVDGYEGVAPSMRPHYFRVSAKNDVPVMTSEVYATRASARRGVLALVDAMREILHVEAFGISWPPAKPEVFEYND